MMNFFVLKTLFGLGAVVVTAVFLVAFMEWRKRLIK